MVVLQVHTGRELYVADSLISLGIPTIAPRKIMQERHKGNWTKLAKILFPGYIFIDTNMDDNLYYKILKVDGTSRFLNHCAKLPSHEAEYIRELGSSLNNEICDVQILKDGSIKILNGWLTAYSHKIISYSKRQRRLTLQLTLYDEPIKVTCSVNFIKSQTQAYVGDASHILQC